MSIQKLEAELEATRQKIAKQLSMVGRSIQSIDPTLHEKERELEQAVIDAYLDAEMVANAEEALDKLPDETFIPISNYIDFLKKLSEEQDDED